jgi:hypothetical protein
VRYSVLRILWLPLFSLVVFSGCNTEHTVYVNMDCTGFTMTASESSKTSVSTNAYATDSLNNVIIDQTISSVIPAKLSDDPNSTIQWTKRPTKGQITLILKGIVYHGNCGSEKQPVIGDGRINDYDPAATIIGYCKGQKLVIWVLDSDGWCQVGIFTQNQINAVVSQAAKSGKYAVLLQSSGHQVRALPTGELQLHTTKGAKYDFNFPTDECKSK